MGPVVLVVFAVLSAFLAALPGAASVKTFRWLSARRGGSVTIPCFYDQEYRNSVKYWCKGSKQTVAVRTDSPRTNDQVSISDDPAHLVFYVTMRSLEQKDAGTYWCAVQIDGVKAVFAELNLHVLAGVRSVWTESWISVETGGSVGIPCYYDEKYRSNVKYWCKGYYWMSCTTVVRTDSPPSEGEVSIADDPDQLVFNVTMSNVREKDSDTYWCVVEINGGQDDGVFLPVVIGKALAALDALTTPKSTLTSTGMTSPRDSSSPDSISAKNNSALEDNLGSFQQPVFLLILEVLVPGLGVAVVMGTLIMLRKQKEARDRNCETHGGPADAPAAASSEVFYSVLLHPKPEGQRSLKQPPVKPEDETIYSDTA